MSNPMSNKDSIEAGEVPRRESPVRLVDVSYSCKMADRVIRWIDATAVTGTITLLPVAKAAGIILSVAVTIAHGGQANVVDRGDSEAAINLDMDTTGDAAVLYCDGLRWWVIKSAIA